MIPQLNRILEGHGAWFPWRTDEGLRLADADRAIFRWADDGQIQHVRHLLHWIGDGSLYSRVSAWRALGALAGDDRRPSLTEEGRRLVGDGVPTVSALAPLWVGGCRVNDPATPWLRLAEPDGWRITAGT
jgi:hypothetical protein